ncbi:hypothetical protein SDC9_127098 [bioreactor metagenome]|uniref:Uncharacterized protein n=1 Tax=bioreactor metagenome TaxID=1076179 RepID=A0A645CT14_9ZZZZ
MKTPSTPSTVQPPKLIQTLVAGFNLVANNIMLILLPVILDLTLWLGPKIKITNIMADYFLNLQQMMTQLGNADLQAQSKTFLDTYSTVLSKFNLGVAVRTFPVGVPSLLSRELAATSPLKVLAFEVPSEGTAILIIAALTLVGFFLGAIYFNAISRYTIQPVEKFEIKQLFSQYGQSLVMFLVLAVVLMIIILPGFSLISIFVMLSPTLGQFLIIMAMVVLLWLVVPLIFSPHGIFVLHQRSFQSILLSIRMVRFFLPGTGMFVLTAILISEGMNLLWELPDPSSWLTLVGIAGHAFIVTAMLAASFIYYREGLHWMQENIQRMNTTMGNQEIGGPFGTTKQ